MQRLFSFIVIATVLVSLCSCSKKNYAGNDAYHFKSATGKPDYSDLHYWAAHPWKWDPSDSIPKPLRKDCIKDSIADVFFLYPTTLTDPNDERWNASIDDSLINAKTDYSTILYQASAFSSQCRVFAPRYRQAHYRVFTTSDTAAARKAFDLAYDDIRTAFQYYLDHYNNGRPIIIASHSQGTIHAARLLKEFFEGKALQTKLVCAYLIGMPIPENYFSNIPPCKDSLATGCVIGWRTFKKGYNGTGYVINEKFKSIVINPLTWTTTTGYAGRSLNKGGVLKNFNKVKKGVVDAQVHDNILWSSKPRFFGNFLLTTKNYHIADINFFYSNIVENVHTRIRMYLKM